MYSRIFRIYSVEENFNIDEHINKIKSQMEQASKDDNPPLSDVPSDILEQLPNDEPSLENYSDNQEENLTQPVADETNQDVQTSQDITNYDEQWHDPFGTSEHDAVKKYVIYISKDFVPYIDNMDKDARSAYVNEAIQLKIDLEGKDKKWHLFKRVLRHVIVSVFTLVIAVPALFWLADKSITATVQNYGYVQKNFEKLYKDKIEREKAVKEIQQMRLGL